MILITGASGHVGRLIAEFLAKQKIPIRLMTRNKDKAPKLESTEVVQADYADPASLNKAFEGIESAFIVSGYAKPGDRALLHKNAIDAAVKAGVKHLIYLSFQNASPESKFPMGRDHFQTEQFLMESGIQFTSLRDNFYLDVVPTFFNAEGILCGPAGSGKAAWITREDVARTAVELLINPEQTNNFYNVTGPETLTMTETAERLTALTGRKLSYKNETLKEGRMWRSQFGAPDWEVDTWLGSYEAIAAGELAETSNTVLKFTRRKPMNIEEYFSKHPDLLEPLIKHKK